MNEEGLSRYAGGGIGGKIAGSSDCFSSSDGSGKISSDLLRFGGSEEELSIVNLTRHNSIYPTKVSERPVNCFILPGTVLLVLNLGVIYYLGMGGGVLLGTLLKCS